MSTCENVVKSYLGWLNDQFVVEKEDGSCRIATPYLSPDGDYIDVLISQEPEGRYVLTDDGAVVDFLYLSGIDIDRAAHRRQIFEMILNKNGVTFDKGMLSLNVSQPSDLEPSLHQLIQAIQESQSLVFSAKEGGTRVFREEVSAGLNEKGVEYSANIILPGLAKLEHRFDFGRVTKKGQIVIQTLSTTNPAYASQLAIQLTWSFLDVRKTDKPFVGVSVIDDSEDVWKGETLNILKTYCDDVVPWSESERLWKLVA